MPKQPYFHRIPTWTNIDRALREAAEQIAKEQRLSPAVAYQCAVKAAQIDAVYQLLGAIDAVSDKITECSK